jgi:transcriptional regulator with GAF, ATPase, and Fis domain
MPDKKPPDFEAQTDLQADRIGLARACLRQSPEVRWTDERGAHAQRLGGRAVVGSAPGADLVIADAAVSRIHAELEPREDGVWVHDLGSSNGTYVEGIAVGLARIPEGGQVRVGSTDLVVSHVGAPEPVPLWPEDRFGELVGRSPAMRELFNRLAEIAGLESALLIQGETGTGKELVARSLHEASARRAGPYVIVDCAALPETLLEAELFGHAKGAFTGAGAARCGALEAADGGTVFLDEIGELPLSVQPKLLRAIETRSVRRIGETRYRPVNVRFISATHRDLRTMVNAGAFREDLYFRVAVLPISVPPLRERPEDIPLLVEHFLPPGSLPPSSELVRELSARPWLGNVRELRNFVERAQAFGAREALALSASESSSPGTPAVGELPRVCADRPFKEIREQWTAHLERDYLSQLLERHGRNMRAVAQAAGLDPTYVYRLVKKHEL